MTLIIKAAVENWALLFFSENFLFLVIGISSPMLKRPFQGILVGQKEDSQDILFFSDMRPGKFLTVTVSKQTQDVKMTSQ